ncbi:fluoride efflux transporter FluC [Halorubrum vacuolatum]|uniref:Fluoride-specific ion channel FluC n=1 Tax=Halorubrum vacuolatum TaxID=63740 RepID=A0A238YEF6_HALVU|nr:CrcB family protein [Halorubrum vacuolatum]SNR69666.1 camphor resistance protein CrcB [Halorubrum vacuolatum]
MIGAAVSILLIGTGGAAGAVARHTVGSSIEGRESVTTVNLVGSFILGVVSGVPGASSAMLLVGVGFCGAFTTFSSFAVETVTTAESGDPLPAAQFTVANLIGAIGTLLLGSLLVSAVF